MAESSLNTIDPNVTVRPGAAGDAPVVVRRRYLTERRDGGVAYFVDATAERPEFHDLGQRLSTDRNDPAVVRDMIAIARHRGWAHIAVRGHTDFRRQVWLAGQLDGLEVAGYRPTERDRQDLERRSAPPVSPPKAPSPTVALAVAEAVVRARVVEPAECDRVLRKARDGVAVWLDRERSAARRDRGR